MPETVTSAIRRRRAQHRRYPLDRHRGDFVSEAEAFALATGRPTSEYAGALREFGALPLNRDSIQPVLAARPGLVRLMFAIVRCSRPDRVVETGVAEGVSTAAALSAMSLNRHGHLYSIDLPVLSSTEGRFVGRLVPDELRDRWSLELGPANRLLGPLVERLAPIDLFLHDSDHSYSSQWHEYETAWPCLRPGGTLISDDVANPAFFEFASSVRMRPYLVGDPAADSAVGLLHKQPA